MDRIVKLCSLLDKCTVFADIGCDHGYVAEYMLKNNLCEKAYITDISEKSLHKAEILLKDYIAAEKCIPIVADGLKGVPKADFVLIAGMGGDEIVKILNNSYIPQRILIQPMKNAEKVRRYLVGRGAHLTRDFTFSDGKRYYDLISARASGGDSYTENEFFFGKENLLSPSADFYAKWEREAEKLRSYLSRVNVAGDSYGVLTARLSRIEEILRTSHIVRKQG